jgi:pyruvyltransferase
MKKIYDKVFSEKIKLSNLKLSQKIATEDNAFIVKWSESNETINNFGDALNPWLLEKLAGEKPNNINRIINYKNKTVYSAIGSILDFNSTKELVVWGSGFKYENNKVKRAPKMICAVRGPLSRENFIKQGIKCPEVYGDPALLLPYFYNPAIEKKYKIGIIPHYVDKNTPSFKNLLEKLDENSLVIDIENGIYEVIDQILSCELIASSSLHGLIVADAYGIPSKFLKFSDNIAGGNFKFRDYMYSVGRVDTDPIKVNEEIQVSDIIDNFSNYKIDIDLNKLMEVCPFKNHK